MLTKDKVKAFMKQQNMLNKGDHVLIGLSGGADSVCLFHILQSLKEEYRLQLTAVHVEHGIRGEEALEDAEYVSRLCEEAGVPCYVEHIDVPKLAKEEGLSEEEMGRNVRYEIFERVAKQVGANRIAVAHHANDVAETMLFHLCRGTGLAGLCALTPVRGNIIRPLLSLNRTEIETYLQSENITYRTDSTNKDTKYTRNYIRHEILPLMENVNPKAVEHLVQTSGILNDAKSVLEDSVDRLCEKFVTSKNDSFFLHRDLYDEDEYLIAGVLHNVMEKLAGRRKDIHQTHIQSIIDLGQMQVGKRVSLPYNMVAIKEYGGVTLRIESKKREKERAFELPVELLIPGETLLGEDIKIQTRIFGADEIENRNKIADKKCTKWFDYDIIGKSVSVRHRQTGDYMVVDENGGRKKLKDLLINEKVPQGERNQLLLFAQGDLVLWTLGVRMGEYGKINTSTKQVLEIRVYGGKIHE